MKHLRQLCAGFLLVLVLSIPAFAGVMDFPGITDGPQESPGRAGSIETPGVAGDMWGPGVAGEIWTPGIMGNMEYPGISILLAALF